LGSAVLKLFVAHFILTEEAPGSTVHYITSSLFTAANAEQAYNTAQSWIPGHEDSTHNAAGELVRFYSSGLYDLEEVPVALDQLQRQTCELYGVDVGHIKVADPCALPMPKEKEKLAVFANCPAQPVAAADGFAAR